MNRHRAKVRTYAVERIQKIRALASTFAYPKDFDPAAVLNSAFGLIHGDPVTVKIRFSPKVAMYIREKDWAANQQIHEHPDEAVTLSMITSGYQDVNRWVMSFGKEARVLAPETLKQEIFDELKWMIRDMEDQER